MTEFKADLHCHSTYSDGTDSPSELIRLAIDKGLSALSITDHDTVAAYEEAIPFAQNLNFPLLSGVEFSSFHRAETVHILAYAFPLKSPSILTLCKKHEMRRLSRNRQILSKLKGLGIEINEEEIPSGGNERTIGRPHIAYAMMKKGAVGSIKEAFDRFLGDGKPAYVQGETISAEETLEVIHRANGKAIIAHPHLIKRRSIIRSLINLPFDGIEGYYARLPEEQEREWIQLAVRKNWILTGGSDYHGDVKPYSALGSSWVNEQTFQSLYDHYLKTEAAFKLKK